MKNFSIIVAFDSQYGIGKNTGLPWHLPLDLKIFKEITTTTTNPASQNAVIMGRKTWGALPEKFRPLPGRVNVVLSRQEKFHGPSGVLHAQNLDAALKQLSLPTIENIFVIGGGQVYADAMQHPLCQKIYVTHIQGDYGCDTFFPAISKQFFPISTSEPQTQDGHIFHFSVYLRYS